MKTKNEKTSFPDWPTDREKDFNEESFGSDFQISISEMDVIQYFAGMEDDDDDNYSMLGEDGYFELEEE